ncbi:MAG: sulfite exporter TauE/SafE family protein [Sphingopyxis sp.]
MIDLTTFDVSAIVPFILVGFAAQLVDGALGMAFGVITSTLLVGVLGIPPAQASAKTHIVEIFTTGVSGINHLLHKNIDARLFFRLLIPGVIGGVIGAYMLTNIDGAAVKPYVLAYLAGIGLWLLWRGLDHNPHIKDPKIVAPLGIIGGFLDAAGGGGWGPVVTSNLLVQGAEPRKVIGTVNAVEFFLTLTISATFVWNLGLNQFSTAVVGLLIGGVVAAPLGAVLAKRVPAKTLLLMVGVVLTITSGYGIFRALG